MQVIKKIILKRFSDKRRPFFQTQHELFMAQTQHLEYFNISVIYHEYETENMISRVTSGGHLMEGDRNRWVPLLIHRVDFRLF